MVRRLVATVVAMSVVAGCVTGTPAPSESGPRSPAASPGAQATVADDLFTLNLTITTESASAVVGSIGPDGGQLSTTAADGATYTLDIPSGAVLFAEDISMTPVVEVDGLPGGIAPAHIVGVRLAPDGLELFAPATLRFTPPTPLPVAGVATMGFENDGADAGLELFDQDASNLTVQVEHFSGYVSFWPVDIEWWEGVRRLWHEFHKKRLRIELASELGVMRQKQLRGIPDLTLADLVAGHVGAWERNVLAPLMMNAPRGCRFANEAIAAYVAWERDLQLLGISLSNLSPEEYSQTTEDQRELYGKVRREPPPELYTLKRDLCFEEEFQRCRRTGDFEHLAESFLKHFRQLEMFGQNVSRDDVDLAHFYLARCGRWDLTIESIEDLRSPGGSRVVLHQTRTYTIKWQPGNGDAYGLAGSRLIGHGATAIVEQTAIGPLCQVTNTYHGTAPLDTAEIKRLIFDRPENAEPVPRKVNLDLTFGNQSWTTVEVCPPGTYPSTTTTEGTVENGFYLPTVLYTHNLINRREWRFDNGLFGEGPFSAKMTITDSFTDTVPLPPVSLDVEVIITLEHTPST